MKIIHIGDAHIRAQTWANIPRVSGDAYQACTLVKKHAADHSVDTLLLSGDVFHSTKPSSEDIRVFNYLISDFKQVLYIEGNHEKCDPPWLESFADKRIRQLSVVPDTSCGIKIFGIPYSRSSDELKVALNEVSTHEPGPLDILVLHCGFKHMLNFEGASQLDATDVEFFPGKVLVSHVHKRRTYKNIHSPGPLFPQNWEEVGKCYVDLIDTATGSIEALDVTVRDYHTVNADYAGKISAESSILPPVVRVLTSDPKQTVPDFDGCIVVPVVSGAGNTKEGTQMKVTGKSIEEAIMDEYSDQEDGLLMIDLYNSDSPKDIIDKLLNDNNIERRKL